MKDKKSFVMMEDWTVLLSKLPEQEAGRLIKAICTYQLTGELDESDPIVVAWMSVITPIMDVNNEKHAEKVERMHQNAASSRTKSNQIETDIGHDIDTKSGCVSESESVSVSEYPTDTTIPPTPLPELDLSGMSDTMQGKLREWLQYKKERRESYKPMGMKSLVTQVQKQERELGTQTAVNCIDTAMSNGWKGIQWERARSGTTNKFTAGIVKADYSDFNEEEWIAN